MVGRHPYLRSFVNFVDPPVRKHFGRRMAYVGGVDKRCIAAGGQKLTDEIQRINTVVRDGGYMPSCDHGIPHDVSWNNFVEYCRQLAEITGWL